MSIKGDVQEALKMAMKNKDEVRLACLRMAKGALLLKEKESATTQDLTEEEAIQALRSEVRKRQQSIETYRELGKAGEASKIEAEIAILEAFLPRQLSSEQIEAHVRAYVAEHPDVNHPGKLTGVLKKALGDQADGKVLNEVCRKVLGV